MKNHDSVLHLLLASKTVSTEAVSTSEWNYEVSISAQGNLVHLSVSPARCLEFSFPTTDALNLHTATAVACGVYGARMFSLMRCTSNSVCRGVRRRES